ncbi:hypothetical protein FRC10_009171 [Ceratobasidium sp. 414]|nr:hypothetical protein FRC10_009171 [Ceratobasidium sp. 414]
MADIHSTLALLDTYVSHQSTPQDQTVKLLRALVEHAPTVLGRHNICQDILACRSGTTDTADSTKLFELKECCLIVAKGGKTPQGTGYASGTESVELQAMPNELVDDTKLCHFSATSDVEADFEQALARDNYRSVTSRQIDVTSADRGIVPNIDPSATYTFTEAAHILPFSLSEGKDADQVRHSTNVWQLIERFSGIDLLLELGGQDINRLGNVLTLSMQEHKVFGALKWWLEAIEGQPNMYRVDACRPRKGLYEMGAVVTFTTTDEELELPDPRYLAIHAACAKVLFTSGMAEYVDRVIRDMEDLAVLREDGSSDVQLMFALHCIPVR